MQLKINEPLYLDKFKIKISLSQILTTFKYKKNTLPHKKIVADINSILKEQQNILKPEAILFFSEVFVEAEKIYFYKNIFLSKSLAKVLKNSKFSVLFLTTVGETITKKARQSLKNKNYFSALVYDTLGSQAVEKCAQIISAQTKKFAIKNNLDITQRFSPGYSDWHLSEQKKIFKILKPKNIRVRLTKNFMMIPEKTISAVIGIGNNLNKNCKDVCLDCNLKNCSYRKSLD